MEYNFGILSLLGNIPKLGDGRGNGRTTQINNLTTMKSMGIKYEFSAKPWQYDGPAGWHFVSLPKKLAKEIRNALKSEEEGWARLKANAKIGNSEWKTAIWFDTKRNTYLLPLKAEIRKKENLAIDKEVATILWI